MFVRLIDGRGHWVVAAGLCGVVALLVWLAFGRDHVRTVTQTRTETVTKVSPAMTRWNRDIQTLANYVHPQQATKIKCPKGVPATVACYVFNDPNFYMTVALPAS